MKFDLSIKTIVHDLESGQIISESTEPVGTATLEQVHGWLSTGDNRMWEQLSPAPALLKI